MVDAAGSPARLQRDAAVLSGYAMLATFGWLIYTLGPTVPLLRIEQATSRTVAGLHTVAYAVGVILAGSVTARVVARVGRDGALRLGLAVVSAAVVGLVVGSLPDGGPVAVTVAATLVAGSGASLAANAANAVLSDRPHPAGAAALTEGNAVAALLGILAPLSVGAAVSLGLTWRAAVLLLLPLAGITWWLAGRAAGDPSLRPEPPLADGDAADGRMPVPYWVLWVAMVACIMVETAFVTWTPDLLIDRVGLGEGGASAALTAFLAGMAGGRLALTPLSLRWPGRTMFALCLVLALVGWGVLWASTVLPVAVGGLLLAGLGVAGHFPLGSMLLITASGGPADRALGIMAVGIGAASGAGPFLLGAAADRFGIHGAFVLVPACLTVALVGLGLITAPADRGSTPGR